MNLLGEALEVRALRGLKVCEGCERTAVVELDGPECGFCGPCRRHIEKDMQMLPKRYRFDMFANIRGLNVTVQRMRHRILEKRQ